MELNDTSKENLKKITNKLNNRKLVAYTQVSKGWVAEIDEHNVHKFHNDKKCEEYIYPVGFGKFCQQNKKKLRIKMTERKHVAQVIIQSFSYLGLNKNKIKKPIYSIMNFKQVGI